MSRRLEDLSSKFRPLAEKLIAELRANGTHFIIVDTLRTPEEHAANVKAGKSWTKHSKHLDGNAMDLALTTRSGQPIWSAPFVEWEAQIGVPAERLGLIWGGRWKVRDLGHVELP